MQAHPTRRPPNMPRQSEDRVGEARGHGVGGVPGSLAAASLPPPLKPRESQCSPLNFKHLSDKPQLKASERA